MVMVLRLSFPAKTVPEFIAHAKANPGKISFASFGTGSVSHFGGLLFNVMTGVDLVHVPYRGSPQALTDLITRQPDLRQKLSELLVEASYPVARLDCDRGDQTYVLLNDRQLVAIYRDGDIGAIERLVRR